MKHLAVRVEGLDQGYRKKAVLTDFTCEFSGGVTTALLGPNGAGKTTLMRTISTALAPRAGRLEVLGRDVGARDTREAIRREVSYLPQNFTADDSMTVREYVEYCLWLRGKSGRAARKYAGPAIEAVELVPQRDHRLRSLSGGMRQRVGIAAVIAGDPSLILFDEPTVGLDPEQRSAFRRIISDLDRSSVILSTHLLEDAVQVAEHLVVMSEGRVTYQGTADVLRAGTDHSLAAVEDIYRKLLDEIDVPSC